MLFQRFFTKKLQSDENDLNVLDRLSWRSYNVELKDHRSDTILFQACGVDAPEHWSQQTVDIFVSKYLRKAGVPSKTERVHTDELKDVPDFLLPSQPTKDVQFGGETSVKAVLHRLVGAWTFWAWQSGMFRFVGCDRRELSPEEQRKSARVFYDEVAWSLYHQYAAPNSPQFFNTGINWAYGITGEACGHWYVDERGRPRRSSDLYSRSQAHACFILNVEDALLDPSGIYDLLAKEARIFKLGSGSGSNFSKIRAEGEPLSGGGSSSGLMSFLRIFDRSADCIKSGGVTRRAAKMCVVDLTHPDVLKFVKWKVNEERKAQTLIEAGYEADFNGEAYRTVSGQNSNNSVGIPHEFMRALKDDGEWCTWYRLDMKHVCEKHSVVYPPSLELLRNNSDVVCPAHVHRANDVWKEIVEAAWTCADPGVQFIGTMNDWNTLANELTIAGTNPCGEVVAPPDFACNLASINLAKFYDDDQQQLQLNKFKHVIACWQTVLEVSNTMGQLPSKETAVNTWRYRLTGLGPANLGTLLMLMGVPYDSPEGRRIAGSLMAIMSGHSYATSARWAAELSPFPGWKKNSESTLRVVRNHRRAAYGVGAETNPKQLKNIGDYEELEVRPVALPSLTHHDDLSPNVRDLVETARHCWDEALTLGGSYGFRNSQVTACAPTGTVSFVMGCDSTGVEPAYALTTYKTLAGGGTMKLVNGSVKQALINLGYKKQELDDVLKFVKEHGHVHNAPHLTEEHERVFKCAASPLLNEGAVIHWQDHVRMLAALQSFVSGGISKTINLPESATIEDVSKAYILGYKLGCKGITVYRDNCKRSSPLTVKQRNNQTAGPEVAQRLSNETLLDEVVRRTQDDVMSLDELYERLSVTTEEVDLVRCNWGQRRRPNDLMVGFRHRITIGQARGYVKVFAYDDGRVAELFVTFGNPGSSLSNVLECWSIAFSIALQRGEPLGKLCRKFLNVEFEPKGFTGRRDSLKKVTSPVDFIARLLLESCDEEGYVRDKRFFNDDEKERRYFPRDEEAEQVPTQVAYGNDTFGERELCPKCGSRMTSGTDKCPVCSSCGYFAGCG